MHAALVGNPLPKQQGLQLPIQALAQNDGHRLQHAQEEIFNAFGIVPWRPDRCVCTDFNLRVTQKLQAALQPMRGRGRERAVRQHSCARRMGRAQMRVGGTVTPTLQVFKKGCHSLKPHPCTPALPVRRQNPPGAGARPCLTRRLPSCPQTPGWASAWRPRAPPPPPPRQQTAWRGAPA